MSLQTQSIIDFLDPVNIAMISNDEGFKDSQLGKHIAVYDQEFPDVSEADFVIVGCGEMRGSGVGMNSTTAPDAIRSEYYKWPILVM
jgi:formiminoglutamase